jgi:hypothetical protein
MQLGCLIDDALGFIVDELEARLVLVARTVTAGTVRHATHTQHYQLTHVYSSDAYFLFLHRTVSWPDWSFSAIGLPSNWWRGQPDKLQGAGVTLFSGCLYGQLALPWMPS